MKKIFFILFFVTACGISKKVESPGIENDVLSYSIQENLQLETPHLAVTFTAKTNEKGELVLSYKNDSHGEKNLFNCLKDFSVSPHADVDYRKGNDEILIKGKASKVYTFSYQVNQDFSGSITSLNCRRPILNNQYFQVFGDNLLIVPKSYFADSTAQVRMNINWVTLNPSFEIVNSFGSSKIQSLTLTSLKEIQSAVFMGGKSTTYPLKWHENSILFSTPNTWENVNLQMLPKNIFNIVAQLYTFWGENTTNLTTVTLLKTQENCPDKTNCKNELSGINTTNGLAIYSSDNIKTSNQRINRLITHELFHRWIGEQLPNQNEANEHWFSEGFTDYYSLKLLLKNNILSVEEFVDLMNNEVIEPHYNYQFNNIPNSDINTHFVQSSKEAEMLPYRRGFIYAFYLDSKIKQFDQNRSLDDLMRDVLLISKEKKLKFNEHTFMETLYNYKLSEYEVEFELYIRQGSPINLSNLQIDGVLFERGSIPYMRLQEMNTPDNLHRFLSR